jgi:ubiquinone/menaquinone biosynthesis C-methylase UbiE
MRREVLAALQYKRLATAYDRRWSSYVATTTRETISRLPLGSLGQAVLDVGCGTGAFLASLCSTAPSTRTIGVDLVPAMLAVAHRKVGSAALLAASDAERLPFRAASFDLVVSISSFHYWPRPHLCLAEIARVLRPGGRLVLTDWCDDFLACRLCGLVLRVLDPAYHRTYGTAECERLLAAAGFAEERAIETYKIDWLWGLMTASAMRPHGS